MSKTPVWDILKQSPEHYQPGYPGAHDNAVTNGLLFAQNELLERIACALERGPYVLLMNVPDMEQLDLAENIKRAMETIWKPQEDENANMLSRSWPVCPTCNERATRCELQWGELKAEAWMVQCSLCNRIGTGPTLDEAVNAFLTWTPCIMETTDEPPSKDSEVDAFTREELDKFREQYGPEPFGHEMLQQQPPIDEYALQELLEERRKTQLSERRFKERSKLNEPPSNDQGRSTEDEARGETGQAHREAPEGDGGDPGLD